MEFLSLPNAREASRNAKAQRLAAGRWLRVDESKITAPKDMMLLHRVRAAAADRSDDQWRQIEPHLPKDVRGKERVDDRRVISGILHVLKGGCRWCDCPPEYGLMTVHAFG
jgi:hypothetical protein